MLVEIKRIRNLRNLAKADINELRKVWKNKRSWIIAKEIASYLSTLSKDDREVLRTWLGMLSLRIGEKIPLEGLKALV